MADALLTVENLTKSFGDKLLFEDISFGINAGQKSALIARNGYGKSTLLNIIMTAAGQHGYNTLQDSGKITFRGDLKLAYLPQSPEAYPKQIVRDFVYNVSRPETEDPWTFEQRMEEILSRMKVDTLLDRPMETLSGGEQKKVALCRLLMDDCNLLILDEPTNHLDIDMIEWLEDFLSRQRLAILMVTHDRYSLDNVCDNIYELDNSRFYHYKGRYDYYLEKKAEREANERAEVEKARSLYRTELEWMRRMPQARGTKAQARIDAFYELEAKAHTRFDDTRPQLTVKTERIGGKILELYNICYHNLIDDYSYVFKRGEKIGIVGPNGVGKSTFLNIITEKLKPTSGRVVVGQTIQFGYYTQAGMSAPDDHRVIDLVKDIAEEIEHVGSSIPHLLRLRRHYAVQLLRQPQRRRKATSLPAAGPHGQPQLPYPRRAHQRPRHLYLTDTRAVLADLQGLPHYRQLRPLLHGPHRRPPASLRRQWQNTRLPFQLHALPSGEGAN